MTAASAAYLNKAVERTGHSGHPWRAEGSTVWPAAHRGRWVAATQPCSLAWRREKKPRHDRPLPHAPCPRGLHCHTSPSHAQRQARSRPHVAVSTLLLPGLAWRPQAPAVAWRVSGTRPGWRPHPCLGPAACPRHWRPGCGVVGRRAILYRRRGGVSWCAWGVCALSPAGRVTPACPGVRGGGRLWQAVTGGDAVRAVSQQRP